MELLKLSQQQIQRIEPNQQFFRRRKGFLHLPSMAGCPEAVDQKQHHNKVSSYLPKKWLRIRYVIKHNKFNTISQNKCILGKDWATLYKFKPVTTNRRLKYFIKIRSLWQHWWLPQPKHSAVALLKLWGFVVSYQESQLGKTWELRGSSDFVSGMKGTIERTSHIDYRNRCIDNRGARCGLMYTRGLWSQTEQLLHIKCLELLAGGLPSSCF